MCRGGGGLGATSPHKPAFEKTVHLSLFLSPQLPPTFPRWSFCHLLSQKPVLRVSPRESPPAVLRADLFFFSLLTLSSLSSQTALTCTCYEFTSGIKRALTWTGGLVVAFEGTKSWGENARPATFVRVIRRCGHKQTAKTKRTKQKTVVLQAVWCIIYQRKFEYQW